MRYVYNDNLEIVASFGDEIDLEDIKIAYSGCYILDELIKYPKLENDNIVSMDELEIAKEKYKRYKKGAYTLNSSEIIKDDTIVEVILNDFEYIENGLLKFNAELKREHLMEEIKRRETEEKEKPFEFKGYLQPNRELEDQTSLLKIISILNITKQSSFNGWKMKDSEGREHYITLTLQEMIALAIKMEEQTTKAMIKYSKLRESIKGLSEEQLKTYKLGVDV